MTPRAYPDIRMGVWNTRSIVNKPTLLQSLVCSKKLDILCITESWLSSSIRDCEIAPHGYNVFRRDRNSHGGGVLIAVSEKFPSRLLLASNLSEMVAVEVFLRPSVIIGCVYVPPSCSESYQRDLMSTLHSLSFSSDYVICGDFNAPDIIWSTLTGSSPFSKLLCDWVFSKNLVQLVSGPTHRQGNCLDLLFTNCEDRLHSVFTDQGSYLSASDHFLVSACITAAHYPKKEMNEHRGFNFKLADFTELDCYLLDVDYSRILASTDVEFIWINLKSVIWEACNLLVPRCEAKKRTGPRWFNHEVRHLLNRVHTTRRRIKRGSSTSLLSKLDMLEKELGGAIATAKANYEKQLISTFHTNPSKLYRRLAELSRSRSSPQLIIYQDSPVHDPYNKARIFNEFFNSTFTVSDYILPPPECLPSPSSQLSHVAIDSSDVFQTLIKLDPTKAVGCDKIPPRLLKCCATSLMEPITHLLTTSLKTCTIPDEWKIHQIVPILKKGDKTCPTNYRPISLLCTTSKILESIIYDKVAPFIRPLISDEQFGFLKNRSSLTQLLLSYAQVNEAVEKGYSCSAVYLDFSKAFDSVPHKELLFKLWKIGITGPLWCWFREYLSNRKHYVSIDGESSPLLPVISGVPQGSVLGPLLFIIYINDIPERILHSSIRMFADDCKLLKCISSFYDHLLLQEDLNSIVRWCDEWRLKLNASKCVALEFSFTDPDPVVYTMNGQEVSVSECCRDLGILVCGNLSWAKQYSKMCSSAYSSLHMIRRNTSSATPSIRKSLYLSLVRCHFTYCSLLWRPRLIKDIELLERVQRRATKFITGNYEENYKARLLSLKLLPLMYWLELLDIMFLVKSLKNPPDNFDIYAHVTFINHEGRCTRSTTARHLRSNYCRTTYGRHFYFNRVVRLWNAVPPIDLSLSVHTIKRHLMDFFWLHFKANFNPTQTCSFHFLCPCARCCSTHHHGPLLNN